MSTYTSRRALCIVLTTVNSTCAQGTAFTFQGRLNDGTNPANGVWWALVALLLGLLAPVQLLAVDFDPSDLRSVHGIAIRLANANDVAVSGNFAYVAALDKGLKVFEILNSSSGAVRPVGSGYVPTGPVNEAVGVAVADDHAFVAFGFGGLQVVNISRPAAPKHIAGLTETDVYANGVAVSEDGNYAYVATLRNGLQVIKLDLMNPDPGQRLVKVRDYVSPFASGRLALAVAVSGRYAYVAFFKTEGAGARSGLEVIDITTKPNNPVGVGTFDINIAGGLALDVAVSGNYAYVAAGGAGLVVIDITDPTNMVGRNLHPSVDTIGFAWGVAVDDAYAFVADGRGGLRVVDIRNPNHPTEVANYGSANAKSVALSGTLVLVADGKAGLRVFNFKPANPQRVAQFNTDGFAQGVAVSGNLAFLADGDDQFPNGNGGPAGLRVIDIDLTNPLNPRQVGSTDTLDAFDVAVSGTSAYVADEFQGLLVIDVSLAAPQVVRQYVTGGFARSVAVSRNYAYMGIDGMGLRVIDLTQPADQPVIVRNTGPDANDVAVSGDFAYVAAGSIGLLFFDITEPTNPRPVARSPTRGPALGVAVSGNYAYVAVKGAGLQVIDLTQPNNPPVIVDTSGNAYGVAVSGDYAYVADGDAGLQVIDIRQKHNPQRVGGNGYFSAYGVTVSGDKVFVAAGFGGLVILDVFRP